MLLIPFKENVLLREYRRIQMSPYLVLTLKRERIQDAPCSKECVFVVHSKSSVLVADQCEREDETDRFCSVFIQIRSSVNEAEYNQSMDYFLNYLQSPREF